MKTRSARKRFQLAVLAIVLCGPLVLAVADHSARAAGVVGTAATSSTAATAAIPNIALKPLGSIAIGTDATKPLTDGVEEFAIDDRGRFGFLKWGIPDGSRESFMLVDGNGKLVRSIAVQGLAGFSNQSGHLHALAWIQGDRWLLTDSNYDLGATPQTTAWWLDVSTGVATRINGFDSPPVRQAVATGDGGFVTLTDTRVRSLFQASIPQRLTAYDRNGKRRWMIDDQSPKGPNDPSIYFDGIAVTTDHTLAVLEDNGHKLAEYRTDGRLLRIVDVPPGPNDRVPHITSDDGAGGVVLIEHGAVPSRLTLDGKPIAMAKPRYPGGRPFIPQSVSAAPGGQLWVSDGHGLLRLDANGMADHIPGQPPIDPDRLGTLVGPPLVSANGSIYAIDMRTRSIHVFDDNGKHLRVIHADAWLLNSDLGWASVSDRGDIFVARRSSDAMTHEFAHFAPNDAHARIESVVLKETSDSSQALPAQPGSSNHAAVVANSARDGWWVLLAQPGSNNRWVLNHNGLYLVDAADNVLRRSNLTAQGQKLDFIHQAAAVAPDGSIAIVSEVESHPGDPKAPRNTVVTWFSKSGDPVATWPAPAGMKERYGEMDTDGTQTAFLQRSFDVAIDSGKEAVASVVATDLHGKPLFRFVPPAAANNPDHNPVLLHLVQHGGARELWLSDTDGTIDRYAVP